jgi:hypothetical protein
VSKFCGAHRAPRGGVDRIVDAAGALAVIRLAMSSPPRPETIVMILDPDHRGRTIVVVDGTEDDEAVLEIVEHLARSVAEARPDDGGGESWPGALVVASVRLGRGARERDADRWLEACDLAAAAGVELLEWFVVEATERGRAETFTAWCPRDLLAQPPRWRPP